MKLRGSLLVIVCCLVVEFCNINQKEYLLFPLELSTRLSRLIGLGLLFLLYPLVGHLTDVYLTRYRSLKYSFGIIILGICLIVVYLVSLIATSAGFWSSHHSQKDIGLVVLFFVFSVGLGLYKHRTNSGV